VTSKEPSVEPATPVLANKDTFRILIMDTLEHTDLLKAACKNAGHSVVAAQSISEAFAFLDGKDHADVIVCAAYLQDESVFKFLHLVRTEKIHNDSMFMILALAPGPVGVKLNANVEIAGRQLGADAFLSMPVFDAELLIAEIKALLPLVPKLERHRLSDLDAESWDKSLPDQYPGSK
jgi:CheY-like chemotaxis protein